MIKIAPYLLVVTLLGCTADNDKLFVFVDPITGEEHLMKREKLASWSLYGFGKNPDAFVFLAKNEKPVVGIYAADSPDSMHIIDPMNPGGAIDLLDTDKDGELDKIMLFDRGNNSTLHELSKIAGKWVYKEHVSKNTSNQPIKPTR